jgi:hypothetical protein
VWLLTPCIHSQDQVSHLLSGFICQRYLLFCKRAQSGVIYSINWNQYKSADINTRV